MVRSATAILAVMILPALALAQQTPRNHTVVDGDTLWDLAQSYYGDPFEWRRIWEANRDAVEDPNLILPDQVLVIPGVDAEVTDVVVEAPEPMERAREPEPTQERTVFAGSGEAGGGAGFVASEEVPYAVVPRDQVMSAPRLTRLSGEPEHLGIIGDFAGGAQSTETPRTYNRVRLDLDGMAARVGDQFQAFRVSRTIEGVGQVVVPTGIVTVSDVRDGEVIGVVSKEYDRMTLGDFLGPLPPYTLEPGQMAEPVSGGSEAMVMGFAMSEEIHDLGSVAFLDLGTDHGVTVGDEFEYLNSRAGTNVVEGRLQVVAVTEGTASARIVSMDDVVFRRGIVVRLSKKMR